MDETTLLMGSLFGTVAVLTWWIARLVAGRQTEDQRLRQRLRGGQESAVDASGGMDVGSLLSRVGQAAARPFMPTTSQKQSLLRRRMGYAGVYSPAAIQTMVGCKVLFLGAGLAAGYGLGLMLGMAMLGLSLGGLAGYLLPGLWLKRNIRAQQRALERGLPDALDLLVVCVEAGLTIDAAMQRVGQELSLAHPRLSKEMEITHMEQRVGLSREAALRNLGQRTGNAALRALSSMMIQAERFGTSIAQALRVQADTLRVARQHAAEEMAAKASVKLTFPVVLFIFPAVLIVLAGPAAIGLLKSALFAE